MSYGLYGALEARQATSASRSDWLAVACDVDLHDYRNRLLFSVLSGEPTVLRIEPIAGPRGFPSDASKSLKGFYEQWKRASWNASWVSHPELMLATERIQATASSLFGSTVEAAAFIAQHLSVGIQAILAYLAVYEANGYRTRLVFWFSDL